MKAFSRPRQQRRYDMIIDIDKVKVAWSGRCRLVENFTHCRAGGGDCGAPGQDKTAEVDDDERDLHRVRTVADLRQTFYFLTVKSSVSSEVGARHPLRSTWDIVNTATGGAFEQV